MNASLAGKAVTMRYLVAALSVAIVTAGTSSSACTNVAIATKTQGLALQSYDWMIEDGLIVLNPRGLEKTANSRTAPAKWTSLHGSVTFNQYGIDMPAGGMNEAGLSIGIMVLPEAKFPEPDTRPGIHALNWLQYQLDTASTVDDVIASDALIRIEDGAPVHYLVTDAKGNVAAIEWVYGKRIIHTGETLTVPALTNCTWATAEGRREGRMVARLRAEDLVKSGQRFSTSAEFSLKAATRDSVSTEEVFAFLDTVRVEDLNAWQIIYDTKALTVTFRTASARQLRTLDLTKLDFACRTDYRGQPIVSNIQGDLNGRFFTVSREQNEKMLRSNLANTPGFDATPEEEVQRAADTPWKSKCSREVATEE